MHFFYVDLSSSSWSHVYYFLGLDIPSSEGYFGGLILILGPIKLIPDLYLHPLLLITHRNITLLAPVQIMFTGATIDTLLSRQGILIIELKLVSQLAVLHLCFIKKLHKTVERTWWSSGSFTWRVLKFYRRIMTWRSRVWVVGWRTVWRRSWSFGQRRCSWLISCRRNCVGMCVGSWSGGTRWWVYHWRGRLDLGLSLQRW